FFRADAARASSGGAGLGLAIAREIARAHGGDIYATSDAGVTSFTIWIPQGPSVIAPSQSACE
ncbi:ATP-binding protein, partial [Paraeggerthella hominis]|uniref:ATP-binding protein n=1 Tax=Paraeggerthella hominis TaxID=2897351 RepID=UPI003D0EB317